MNVEQIATGEHWYGEDAVELNLVDKIQTSDQVILDLIHDNDVYLISTRRKPTVGEKLGLQAAQIADHVVPTVLDKLTQYATKANQSLIQLKDPKA